MTTNPNDRPQPDTREDQLPDLIDFWPKWEKSRYLMARAAFDTIEGAVTACPGCREGRYCLEHVEATDADLRRDLERQVAVAFCAGEITCPQCADGSDCRFHWRQGIRDVLAGIFPTVSEVAYATGADLFPHHAGYGLGKDRRAVLCAGTHVKYMIGSRVEEKRELASGGVSREASKMRVWLEG